MANGRIGTLSEATAQGSWASPSAARSQNIENRKIPKEDLLGKYSDEHVSCEFIFI
jgi:hypothetical protein